MRVWISGLAVLMVGLSLTACATADPLDYRHWRTAPDHRKVSGEAYLYAQLAYNAYWPKDPPAPGSTPKPDPDFPPFVLSPAFELIEAHGNDEIGLAYSVFARAQGVCAPEVVIAFRGTEGPTNRLDMWHGNWRGEQNRRALGIFDDTLAWRELNMPGARMTVTGHSLGGGIATHISINRPNVTSFAFDGSPLYWRDNPSERLRNVRHLISETGEILWFLRAPAPETDQVYTPFNCTWSWKPITQHDMRTLAVCLTTVAAFETSEAEASLRLNGLPVPELDHPRPEPQHPTCADPTDAMPGRSAPRWRVG